MFDYMEAFYGSLDDIEDNESMAYTAIGMLAAKGREISETMFRFYVSPLDVSEETWHKAIGFFQGLDLIDVECDCLNDIDKMYCLARPDSEFYDIGLVKLEDDDDDYRFTKAWVDTLASEMV